MSDLNYFFSFILLSVHCLSLASLFHGPYNFEEIKERQKKEVVFNNPHEQEDLEIELVSEPLAVENIKELIVVKNENQIRTLIKYFYDCYKSMAYPDYSFPVSIGKLNRDLKFKEEKIVIIKIMELIGAAFDFSFYERSSCDDCNLLIFPFYENVRSRNGQFHFLSFDYNRPCYFTSKNIEEFRQNGFYAINEYKNKYIMGVFVLGNHTLLKYRILI